MMKINGAFPIYPYDPCHPGCCAPDKKGMNFIGERTTEWLMNKVDAKAQEVYYNTDTNEYWMSIGYNKWEKWQGVGSSPTPVPGKDCQVYFGALVNKPSSVDSLAELSEETVNLSDMTKGLQKTIAADEQFVTIAFETKLGKITSISEGGQEAISDFEINEFDDYIFYNTSNEIYDPDEEIKYTITWELK